ncbi:MAG: DnaD domain protein [Anaerolinea sp.]|nr:DnaD domain protein [Anaerolinea sp.]
MIDEPHSPISFSGFAAGKHRFVEVPAAFFTELLPVIDDLDELRITVYAIYALHQREARYRFLIDEDFAGLRLDAPRLLRALTRACERGALLRVRVEIDGQETWLYFLNTETGRRAVEQIQRGEWRGTDARTLEILPERPNIYRLYEANIGPLTPLIADALRDAEREFPLDWIEDALRTAVEANALNWKYVRAVLDRWKREGKRSHEIAERSDGQDPARFISGALSDFIER